MRHDNKPIHYGIPSLPFSNLFQVQILKISIVEKERFILIERNCTSSIVVKDMKALSVQQEDICAVH